MNYIACTLHPGLVSISFYAIPICPSTIDNSLIYLLNSCMCFSAYHMMNHAYYTTAGCIGRSTSVHTHRQGFWKVVEASSLTKTVATMRSFSDVPQPLRWCQGTEDQMPVRLTNTDELWQCRACYCNSYTILYVPCNVAYNAIILIAHSCRLCLSKFPSLSSLCSFPFCRI